MSSHNGWSAGKIAVIGLGYVGLPLAVAFAARRSVIGFDIDNTRIDELKSGFDRTKEVTCQQLFDVSDNLNIESDASSLSDCNYYIISVPTPVDSANQPDLSILLDVCAMVGRYIAPSNIIIFESTVFPGCTEDYCVPVLERSSGLVYNQDFFCGYSPERINPGDKVRSIADVVKVVSGSTEEIAEVVESLYAEIISAGIHRAESIKVAEAAKVIENCQRDVNIAFINELALLFHKLDIDTYSVLRAANTKWNFLDFRPGLVGGHCIGVDPYYLAYRAQQVGYMPEVLLAGRRINNSMSEYVVERLLKELIKKKINIIESRILIMGITFKEDCPDVRNTQVVKIVSGLEDIGVQVDVFDPVAPKKEVEKICTAPYLDSVCGRLYDGIIIAVGHTAFSEIGSSQICSWAKTNAVIFDVKNLFPNSRIMIR